jgi:predicted NBD/HSP70 family sugar kinase
VLQLCDAVRSGLAGANEAIAQTCRWSDAAIVVLLHIPSPNKIVIGGRLATDITLRQPHIVIYMKPRAMVLF